jgi:aminopeptidase-like protein
MNLLKFCKDLYRIPRSITGEGIVKTLKYIQNIIPIEIKTVKSGTKVFDWIIPPEWNINDAYVIELNSGKKVIDFQSHNLHVVGYSIPIDSIFTFEELEKNLYYLEDQPEAIPYITSYYSKKWGFCLSYKQFNKLDRNSKYKVVIDSSFNENGCLTYGELLIKGQSEEEIFFSSYICHSQMVNNELSGPAILSAIAEKFQVTDNYFSMRFILIPETIGSLAYLSENLKELKKNVIAGFNISCVGDERMWGYLPSRKGVSYTDKVAKFVLKQEKINYKSFSWIDDRGSDERQYCMPGVDLPVVCITRSKWDEYEEYHTSLDDFNLVTEKGLNESLKLYLKIIETINTNHFYETNVIGEPQLGRRNLYPKVSDKKTWQKVKNLINIISFCDGKNDLIDICELLKIQYSECISIIKLYESLDLIEIKPKNLNK